MEKDFGWFFGNYGLGLGDTVRWFWSTLSDRFQNVVLGNCCSDLWPLARVVSPKFHLVFHAFQHLIKTTVRSDLEIWAELPLLWRWHCPLFSKYQQISGKLLKPWRGTWRQSWNGWRLTSWNLIPIKQRCYWWRGIWSQEMVYPMLGCTHPTVASL